jgi:recombination protein RecT
VSQPREPQTRPQTVTDAVARIEEQPADRTPAALINAYAPHIRDVLPSHMTVETFGRLASGVLTRFPDVKEAAQVNPWSFVHVLLECARLGHEPGTEQYAITKFNRSDAPGGMQVVGIEMYKGEMARMFNAGGVASTHCDVVYDFEMPGKCRADLVPFRYQRNMAEPVHEPDFLHPDYGNQDHAVLTYAYARLRGGGTSQVVVLPRNEVMKHRAVAKTKSFWDGPFWSSMWKKTSIHELEKWVPTSAEYRRVQAIADAAIGSAQAQLIGSAPAGAVTAEPETEPVR